MKKIKSNSSKGLISKLVNFLQSKETNGTVSSVVQADSTSFSANDIWNRNQNTNDFGGRQPYVPKQQRAVENVQQPIQNVQQTQSAQTSEMPVQSPKTGYKPPETLQSRVAMDSRGNVIPFPVNQGNYWTHVWALQSFEQCGLIIDQLRANHAFYISMEMIHDESTLMSCYNFLSGAAFALDVDFYPLSQNAPIYLICSRLVNYDIDPVLTQFIQQGQNTEKQRETWNQNNQVYPQNIQQTPYNGQHFQKQNYHRPQIAPSQRDPRSERPNISTGFRTTQTINNPGNDRTVFYQQGEYAAPGTATARFIANVNQPRNIADIVNGS